MDGYTHTEPFFTTKLPDPMKAMLVRWKPEKLKAPIFRQAVRTPDGLATSKHKALRYSTFAFYLDRLGWDASLPQKLTCYCCRRGTGNAVDGKWPSKFGIDACLPISTAVRDQVLRHNPQTGSFADLTSMRR